MMLDNLEPTLRTAIMRVLSAMYESQLIESVSVNAVLGLFGVSPVSEEQNIVLHFSDPSWVKEYENFNDISDQKFSAMFIDEETGEIQEKEISIEELKVLFGAYEEDDIAADDLSPNRKLH